VFSVLIYSNCTSLHATRSLEKWYTTSMCLDRVKDTGFFSSLMAKRVATADGPGARRQDDQGVRGQQECHQATEDPVSSMRSKHIDVVYHFSRERVARKEVQFEYIKTENMLADVRTKPVPRVKLETCCQGIGMY